MGGHGKLSLTVTHPAPDFPPALQLPAQRTITAARPLHWLRLGARDTWRCGWLSLAHGLAIALFGAALSWVAYDRFWLLVGACSGFLVMAPVLATSLYAMSRALERGDATGLALLHATWTRWQHARHAEPDGYWGLVRFGLLLALAGTGWVATSAALITRFSPQPVHSPVDFLQHVVLAPGSWLFEAWLLLGGLLAAPLFASSVIAIPLLLDRRVGLLQAVLASWQAVLVNPFPLAIWAALIMGLTLLGLATLMVGLVFVVPVLGHASWHAYRELADVSALPERLPVEGTA